MKKVPERVQRVIAWGNAIATTSSIKMSEIAAQMTWRFCQEHSGRDPALAHEERDPGVLAAFVRLGYLRQLSVHPPKALGAGGMGEVYRARDRKLARDVAIKILPDAWAADS